MVWYQMFEYAVGFWLMKPCEYVMGNNLCAAGCFSIIRATVLLDSEIMTRFSDRSEKAHHFIQRDQGNYTKKIKQLFNSNFFCFICG